MTPEKKEALRLINLFSRVGLQKSIECAKICVDEIYKLMLNEGQHLDEFEDKQNYYSYWEEVKKEIEKL